MQLEDIQGSDPLCVYQNIPVLFLIYNVVLPYPRIDSIWEIFYVSVLNSQEMYFHQTSHILSE